eukprot:TRINITY_DN74327_c0_g1_i1.p1 TRINITY_DN74327_c0_g1~~TRINITY_DN74327_c0_g1_i1.p1  ORF type:complete len:169 (+),score=26.17 TRINITY_DN74327_c0_g1_i1:52-558(+)
MNAGYLLIALLATVGAALNCSTIIHNASPVVGYFGQGPYRSESARPLTQQLQQLRKVARELQNLFADNDAPQGRPPEALTHEELDDLFDGVQFENWDCRSGDCDFQVLSVGHPAGHDVSVAFETDTLALAGFLFVDQFCCYDRIAPGQWEPGSRSCPVWEHYVYAADL